MAADKVLVDLNREQMILPFIMVCKTQSLMEFELVGCEKVGLGRSDGADLEIVNGYRCWHFFFLPENLDLVSKVCVRD